MNIKENRLMQKVVNAHFEQLIIVCNNIGYRCLQLSKVIPAAFICEGCNTEKKNNSMEPSSFLSVRYQANSLSL